MSENSAFLAKFLARAKRLRSDCAVVFSILHPRSSILFGCGSAALRPCVFALKSVSHPRFFFCDLCALSRLNFSLLQSAEKGQILARRLPFLRSTIGHDDHEPDHEEDQTGRFGNGNELRSNQGKRRFLKPLIYANKR
jgi:hypothetical protein